ncbi:STAS domain-containing protein [Streptomyces poonensis]|uniref:Anti-sigma factor antagonist n=1 Tax=Streptomyces poonensis TaxID=68255 RepID=A0A918Q9Z9_9ACTN|nr:STAS domain-containing protein [Streptomyces poonensis]GGZ37049.1 anti-sigma factor antagonist [Streptomyces poonensis]GLJ90138.1 anti-sigma factor antagonist [Streptomyces poonensis]
MTEVEGAPAIARQPHPTGPVVLRVAGELDHCTAPGLTRAVDGLPFGPDTPVVLDLSALDHCDSTGLTVIITAYHRVEAVGSSFSVAGLNSALERILRVVGLDQIFTLYASAEEDVDALNG